MLVGHTPRLTLVALLAGSIAGIAACDKPARPDKTTATSDPVPTNAVPANAQRVAIEANAKGFEPPEVHVEQGRPAVLTFTRVVESSCVDAVKMPWREEPYELPLDKPVNIVIPDTSQSGDFAYSCWMDMVHGNVVIDAAPSP